MTENRYAVKVPKDLADLVPMFMSNRKKEIDALREAIGASDFEQMRQIGHRMKGSGRSYGFLLVTELGMRLEEAARNSDGGAAETCVAEYVDYIEKLTITYE
ncbi:MAG: Hpt domain-containing protein [Betaproteobacteria bacterium]|nr:Hpt domain-containing protein [Betaproteobacteria bacterium]